MLSRIACWAAQAQRANYAFMVSVDETVQKAQNKTTVRDGILTKLRRMLDDTEKKPVVHFYNIPDLEQTYPGLIDLTKKLPDNKDSEQITGPVKKKSIAWGAHNEPTLAAITYYREYTKIDPDYVWVFEDDVGYSGKTSFSEDDERQTDLAECTVQEARSGVAGGGDITDFLRSYDMHDASDLLASEFWPAATSSFLEWMEPWDDVETAQYRAAIPESKGFFPPGSRFEHVLRMVTGTTKITGVKTREHVHRFSRKFVQELEVWMKERKTAWSELATGTIAYLGVLEGRLTMAKFREEDIGGKFTWNTFVGKKEFAGYCKDEPGKLWHALKWSLEDGTSA